LRLTWRVGPFEDSSLRVSSIHASSFHVAAKHVSGSFHGFRLRCVAQRRRRDATTSIVMQEHSAIRFLWLLPLVAVPVMAGVVLQIPDLYQDRKNFGVVAGFLCFAGATSWCFYHRDFKYGLRFLAFLCLNAVILLAMAFDFTKGLPERPVWVRNAEPFAALIASVVMVICALWKPRYAAFIIAGFVVVPMILLLLVSRIGLLIGWW
jgi:hypothetical protein